MKVICKGTGEKFIIRTNDDYSNGYLQSEYWKRLRKNLKDKHRRYYCCKRRILKNDAVIGHHNSARAYRKLGRERHGKLFFNDVVPCCLICHNGRSAKHIKLHKDRFGKNFVPDFAKINQKKVKKRKNKNRVTLIWIILILALLGIGYIIYISIR